MQFKQSIQLFAPLDRIRFVNHERAALLSKLRLTSIIDLFFHLPHRYLDFSTVSTVAQAPLNGEATVILTVDTIAEKPVRKRGLHIVELMGYDASGALKVIFFNQRWVLRSIKPGDTLLVFGKVSFSYGFKQMTTSYYENLSPAQDGEVVGQTRSPILPVHHVTEGLSQAWMRRIVATALQDLGDVADYLPAHLRTRLHLMSLKQCFYHAHFPASMKLARQARRRIAFDEVFLLQLALMVRRDLTLFGLTPTQHTIDGNALRLLMEALPFDLSNEQLQAVNEILTDMGRPRIMNRMLLGDVGTGKTAVAACALAAVHDSGAQAAMMAPTGVLAQQYASKLGPLLTQAGITWDLLVGDTPAPQRAEILTRLRTGETTVLFGTHTLIQESVQFKKLTLVVVDEQHRFGVDQRNALRAKGKGCDLLVMTATPIPRSLALALYGDLDRSVITTRPVAGAGVHTKALSQTLRYQAYEGVVAQLEQGHQAYVICPLVGTTYSQDQDQGKEILAQGQDPSQLKAAEQEAVHLQKTVFVNYRVGLLTGRMKAAEKERVMEDFRAHKIDVLVSTTVVEVGVDIPNATAMIIENAERFGLAQLHQLRGRVGRGKDAGYVYLVSGTNTKTSTRRIKALEEISDGFELALQDLKQRKEGEVLGYRQHGAVTLAHVHVADDLDLIEAGHAAAAEVLREDPQLTQARHGVLRLALMERYGDVFAEVSGG